MLADDGHAFVLQRKHGYINNVLTDFWEIDINKKHYTEISIMLGECGFKPDFDTMYDIVRQMVQMYNEGLSLTDIKAYYEL